MLTRIFKGNNDNPKKHGSVNNIKIISSNLDRDLQRLAKKALQQWRFEPIVSQSTTREVMFKFTANAN